MRDTNWVRRERAGDRKATATVRESVTTDEALGELRDQFPDVEIQFTARANAQGWRVWLGLRGGNFYGGTLDEAMDQIRKWREGQQS